MKHSRLSSFAVKATLAFVVMAGVACGGGALQSSDGAAGEGRDASTSTANTAYGDETMQAVDKALNRPSQPIIAGQEIAPAPRPASPPQAGGGIASAPAPPTTGAPDTNANTADRKIVQTASLKMQVKDVGDGYREVTRIATTAGGFVSTSNVADAGDSKVATLSLRVPANRYQQVLTDLRALGVKVDTETSNASDVTEEYADLASRQRNLEAAETQLLTLLGNAKTVAEVLQVQDRLTTVRGQIEQAKGRQALLDKLSDLATISITLRPVVPGAQTADNGPQTLGDRVDEAWSASFEFLESIAGVFVTVLVFSWWLPLVAAPLAVIGWRMSRKETAHQVALD